MTKVFISWSGEKSQKIGKALADWLPSVLQSVQPYYSPDDIEKGTKWSTEISQALSDSDIGIICLTPENLEKSWILFEAGALAKKFDESRVCTALFGVEPANIKPPLSTFQNTQFKKDDFKKLVRTINAASKDRQLTERILDDVFEKWWPDLETTVNAALADRDQKIPRVRPDRELIEEILELTRRIGSSSKHRSSELIPLAFIQDFSSNIKDLAQLSDRYSDLDPVNFAITICKMMRYIFRRLDHDQIEILDSLMAELEVVKSDIVPF